MNKAASTYGTCSGGTIASDVVAVADAAGYAASGYTHVEIFLPDGVGNTIGCQTKIFDAYFTTKKNDKGTGLGLYMSKTILEKVNGTISVNNKKTIIKSNISRNDLFISEIKLFFKKVKKRLINDISIEYAMQTLDIILSAKKYKLTKI